MKKILLIDDDNQFRILLKRMIESEGYQVDEAENGEKGFLKAQTGNYDLILTDVYMPEKDGLEILIELKRSKPDQKILAISGGPSTPTMVSLNLVKIMEQFGVDKMLEKPITKDVLMNAIRQVLD